MICPLAEVEEVFKESFGAVYQCSRKNCYWLEFKDTTTAFKISDFFLFKKTIDAIDIEKMLSDTSRTADFELVMPHRTDRCFILSAQDVLNLREVLAGAKFMIELNSEVKRILRKEAVLASF
ncbi:hypothetical protein [Sphingobacterium psychroaquaticum]|uniref:Uncharacterized protein n=1 Tax=Sphingobacterium psychroaquaticum TaxID=561061 RepID=A0A1X7I3Q8_9SPHI|nr:hypothetical protein [Sphingobacterium psychroaquaticum]QBQ41984.1 hypothetical protein E2P86_12820 [Sphingobacterium psychroaquaticum]SMG08450.1 hypothetical protein SAMN05660862_0382 [Sphingobacterium psychroaquaticum]